MLEVDSLIDDALAKMRPRYSFGSSNFEPSRNITRFFNGFCQFIIPFASEFVRQTNVPLYATIIATS